ncbi:hypothetical protein DFH09DRAFT_1151153 [Mycena vulgaris]|nr:hypothetical protein DFH09DRAFT_1151153 [Mycena vulgaris]
MSFPLPDEIISEILSPALKISDEAFSDTYSISPFASYSQSTSAFLLVCKAWLRVSTPLLYNVVVVRSKAQARALETALKSNKDLGMFIKKLRVEGGYGLTLKSVLQYSPNISDLFVSLAIWSSDGVAGFCQGLHLIDPVRLILYDVDYPGNNKQNLRLVQKLAECIQLWKKLRIVDLPYPYDDWETGTSRCSQICAALATAPFLEEVVIPVPASFGLPSYITDIRANPSLKTVKIKEPLPRDHHIIETIDNDPTLKELVQYSVESDHLSKFEVAPSLNPSFVPLESASPEVQDQIWGRILYFALDMEVMDEDLESDAHIPSTSDRMGFFPNLATIPVSQQFKRLAVPYLYRHISLGAPGDLAHFSTILLEDPRIAQHVRSLAMDKEAARQLVDETASFNSDEPDDGHSVASETEQLMHRIIPLLSGLVSFTGGFYDVTMYPPHPQISNETLAITWNIFQALGTAAGSSLRRFCLEVVPPVRPQSHLVFEPFLALRSLEWKCMVEFSLDPQPNWASGALANLECLSLVDYDSSFLTVLEKAELPSLRRVYFHEDLAPGAEGFLKRHGSKLTQIMLSASDPGTVNVLDTCPDLPLLICCSNENILLNELKNVPPSIELFSPTEPHRSLAKIIFQAVFVYSRKEEKATGKFLEALDMELLPALREIQVYGFYWPTTEREIAKSFWVVQAESLLKKNVRLTDMDGKHWTPRLKATGR